MPDQLLTKVSPLKRHICIRCLVNAQLHLVQRWLDARQAQRDRQSRMYAKIYLLIVDRQIALSRALLVPKHARYYAANRRLINQQSRLDLDAVRGWRKEYPNLL